MSAKLGATARGRRVARLLAFGVLLAGLLAMHTLGHPGGHSGNHTPGLAPVVASGHASDAAHAGHAPDADALAGLAAPAVNLVMAPALPAPGDGSSG